MKKFINIFLLAFVAYAAVAQDISSFSKGNALYQKGLYDQALQQYKNIVNSGKHSADLYYNMGNCFFKKNEIPQAILYYEKAKLLSPSDEDINFNIKLANLRVVDKVMPVPKVFYQQWIDNIAVWFSARAWSWILIMWVCLACSSVVVFYGTYFPWLKRTAFFTFIVSLLFIITSFAMAEKQHRQELGKNYAIIFSPSVAIKSSPDEASTDLFILHEGTKIKLDDNIGDWYKVRLSNGNVGWIKQSNFKEI